MPEPLDTAIVLLRTAENQPAGLGFVAGGQAVVTCAHVVDLAVGGVIDPVGSPIRISFPFLPGRPEVDADVVWYDGRPGVDLAGLVIPGDLPPGAAAVRLARIDDFFQHRFRAFGIPFRRETGTWASGQLLGRDVKGRLQLEGDFGRAHQVTPGFSGTPLWDDEVSGIAGMVVAGLPDQAARTAYALTANSLIGLWPALEQFARPANPYRGLESFTENDAANFHGRTAEVHQLLGELVSRASGIVPVTGASGVGKSSLILAGVVPELRAEGALIASLEVRSSANTARHILARALLPLLEPGLDAVTHQERLRRLAALMAGPGAIREIVDDTLDRRSAQRLVFVADQAEHLVTLGPGELADLLGSLAGLTGHQDGRAGLAIQLIMAVRLDLIPWLEPVASAHGCWATPYFVGSMTAAQLREVITEPAAERGIRFEDGLVDQMLRDAGGGAQALPLLEFALTQLWDQESGGLLHREDYTAIGEVGGALAQYAEQTWNRLNREQQEETRQLLLRLVRITDDGSAYRRPTRSADLSPPQAGIARGLADTRLLSVDAEVVDLAHDALIERWPRLHEWVANDRRFLAWRSGLADDLERWRARERSIRLLLTGDELKTSQSWLQQRPASDFSAAERAFVEESTVQRRRSRRRRQMVAAVVGVIVLLGVSIGAIGVRRADADRRERDAHAAAGYVVGQLSRLAPDTAALLAVAAYRDRATPETVQALFDTYIELSAYQRLAATQGGTVFSADSDLGLFVRSDPQSGLAGLYRTNDPEKAIWPLKNLSSATLSPDGSRLATIDRQGDLSVWNVARHRKTFTAARLAKTAYLAPAWSPDSRFVAVPDSGLGARVLDTYNDQLVTTQVPAEAFSTGPFGYGAVSGDLYTAETGGEVLGWNRATGQFLTSRVTPTDAQFVTGQRGDAVAVCVDAGSASAHWALTDPVTGVPLTGVSAHLLCDADTVPLWLTNSVLIETENPAGPATPTTTATSITTPTAARIVDLSSAVTRATVTVPGGSVQAVDESGNRIVTLLNNAIALLRVAVPAQYAAGAESVDLSPKTSPDGRLTATVVGDGHPQTGSLWPQVEIDDPAIGTALHTLSLGRNTGNPVANNYVQGLEFATDGTLVTEAAGVLEHWDVRTGRRIGNGLAAPPSSPAFAVLPRAGPVRIVGVGLGGRTLTVWELAGGRSVGAIGPFAGPISGFAISPDGSEVVVAQTPEHLQVGRLTSAGSSPTRANPGGVPPIVLDDATTAELSGSASGENNLVIRSGDRSVSVQAPAGTALSDVGADRTGHDLVLTLTAAVGQAHPAALPVGVPFTLPVDPGQWADQICGVVRRGLSAQERSESQLILPSASCP